MVKVYYGNGYKEAMYGAPIYTNNATQVREIQKAYACVSVEDVTYEDVQYMKDETRKELYRECTGKSIRKINDKFWNWAEEYFEMKGGE